MECGIIGPPLSGKSTLFNLLTGTAAAAGRTSRGVARVPDSRLDQLTALTASRKTTPATVTYLDVPGRPAGESPGEPYSAALLAELRQADMLALVVRGFTGLEPPRPDRDIIDAHLEFIINDLAVAERKLERLAKLHDPESRREGELLERCRAVLLREEPLRSLTFTPPELKSLGSYAFLSLKPLLVVVNIGEDTAADAAGVIAHLREATGFAAAKTGWVAVAAGIEAEMVDLEETDRAAFLEDLGFKLPALERVIRATYDLLGLITFFTTSEKETRAWPLRDGSTALGAAAAVHEDIARGFIRAEVCSWTDLLETGSYAGLRTAGKLRLEGRDYRVQDGDVIHVRFNV